jgi:hypothetical protein
MKKTFAITLAVTILFGHPAALSASTKLGSNCTKLGQIQKSGKSLLVCDATKGKRVWRNANSYEKSVHEDKQRKEAVKLEYDRIVNSNLGKRCVVGGICKVGNTGPGGGIVFYDEGSKKPWGRYLEIAPNGWSGTPEDPTANWCEVNKHLGAFGKEIGTGRSNTSTMVATCTSGAAVIANSYTGGGKTDWFLPSNDELNELCKFAKNQYTGDPRENCTTFSVYDEGIEQTIRKGFTLKGYWSSTENSGDVFFIAHKHVFSGYVAPWSSNPKTDFYSVRPIRAF